MSTKCWAKLYTSFKALISSIHLHLLSIYLIKKGDFPTAFFRNLVFDNVRNCFKARTDCSMPISCLNSLGFKTTAQSNHYPVVYSLWSSSFQMKSLLSQKHKLLFCVMYTISQTMFHIRKFCLLRKHRGRQVWDFQKPPAWLQVECCMEASDCQVSMNFNGNLASWLFRNAWTFSLYNALCWQLASVLH